MFTWNAKWKYKIHTKSLRKSYEKYIVKSNEIEGNTKKYASIDLIYEL